MEFFSRFYQFLTATFNYNFLTCNFSQFNLTLTYIIQVFAASEFLKPPLEFDGNLLINSYRPGNSFQLFHISHFSSFFDKPCNFFHVF